jgi:glycogen debranching enzyme
VRVVQAVQSHRTLSALSSIAAALEPTDPDRAARLFTDAERIANSITDAFWKARALIDVAKAVAPAIVALRQWPLRSPTDQCIGHVAGTAF